MNLKCKRCLPKEGIEVEKIDENLKQQIVTITKDSKILGVKFIMDNCEFSHLEAKFLIQHLNIENEKCHNCKTSISTDEYVICKKCQALNINWLNI
ncbi:hypothetical protein [Aureivirga sp. CE67]|uniref:hypothetical protein n=1 Tax=Aureivirga sp. CE67 TaxID=1788983 RepID=UPI0018CA7754|nr:hypothetical protein [Aureivirga sp. CE67]